MSSYILLSAGSGRSMQSRGAKSLLPYDGLSVIDHQIKTILSSDSRADITIVTGVGHDKIVKHVHGKKYDVRILLNYNYKLTSQTESLRLALNSIRNDSVYIIHGDMIFNEMAISCDPSKNAVMLDGDSDDKKSVGVAYSNGYSVNLSYGLDEKWAQIVHISKKDFAVARSVINSFKNNKLTFEYINMLHKHIKFSILYDGIKTIEITKRYEELSNNN